MRRSLPPYVYAKGKKGYLYFTRHGKTQRMYQKPGTAEFAAEYALLMRGKPPAPKRTIAGLIQLYQKSEKWPALAANTRKSYLRHFDYLRTVAGGIDPATLRQVDIYTMRDALRDKPTDASRKISTLSTLLTYAVRIGWMDRNPALGVEKLKGSKPAREPWPANMVEKFRESAPDRARLIFELLLGTGQRIGDVLAMRWDAMDAGGITVTQGKTGAQVYVPLTEDLRAILDSTPRTGRTIVAQPNGLPLSYNAAWKAVMEVRTAIGAERWDMHCLRHSAAAEILSLPGMTIEHVMAITGHTSAEMAMHYARRASMRERAKEAQNARGSKPERGNGD